MDFSPPLNQSMTYFKAPIVDLPFNRDIFPEGLPPSYVFVATLRLKGPSSKLTFDLWRVLSVDRKIQAAVSLSGKDKTVAFASTGVAVKKQSVVFRSGFQVWACSESSSFQFRSRLLERALTSTAPPSGSTATQSAGSMLQFPWQHIQLNASYCWPTTSCHHTPPDLQGPSVRRRRSNCLQFAFATV